MLIGIDAGHGHNTAGKRIPDDSMREWDFNSNVATKVCNILNQYGIDTYRSDDITGATDVPLKTRTNNINARNAKLCVSIHVNAYTDYWNNANGIETYIIARGGQAEKIANIVQRNLVNYTGRRNRGVKTGNLHMVRETKMPAILCECGFMGNREEAELLKSEHYRQLCANAITDGLLEYLGIQKKNLRYKSHLQEIGWTDFVNAGEVTGTTGQSRRLEAIQIDSNDLQYRVHLQDIGWTDWYNAGEIAGTTGQSRRLEAIEFKSSRELIAQAHVEKEGWQAEQRGTNITIGTTGKSLRLEAFWLRYA